MRTGIFGVIVPALMKGPTGDFMRRKQIPFSRRAVKKEFRGILRRQPEIGGRKNNLLMGLYLAAYFMAVCKADPAHMTEPVFEELVSAVCASDLFRRMCQGREFFTEKNMETRRRLATDPEFNSYEANWKYSFSWDRSVPECTITYTRCAICEMAKRENCFPLMKYLCVTDFVQQELMGNRLIRTKTLGSGDECCDFHIIGRKAKG